MAVSEQNLKQFGSRLALLLASSNYPDEVKESLAAMIPEMHAKQLDQLSRILERDVATAAAQDTLGAREEVQKAQAQYAEAVKKSADAAMAKMEDLEKKIT